ncbi:MAG: hypothetical protein AAF662_03250 [Pseudomonadota bacterium]
MNKDQNGKDPISIVQRGNLRSLETTLRKQWRLGQSIVLCWCWDERGLLVIFVPHYFLGNYCASKEAGGDSSTNIDGSDSHDTVSDNEAYVRDLISGRRRKGRDELFSIAVRLGVSPTFIKLENPLEESIAVMGAVEQIIRRYGISFVEKRAVLLFDISDFSLFSSFEQASQLNSLSYSMNSAYNKLLTRGIEVNFSRTTTGDGYYVWNREIHPKSDQELFLFLLLVLADNAVARAASKGNTVPVIRSAFHIGSHYELYQAQAINPTVFSYIVGDVTIELARIVEKTLPGQVVVGDFATSLADGQTSNDFVEICDSLTSGLEGMALMGEPVRGARCWLSHGASSPLDLTITDKHGLEHNAFNLQAELSLNQSSLTLGLPPEELEAAGSLSSAMPPENAGNAGKVA